MSPRERRQATCHHGRGGRPRDTTGEEAGHVSPQHSERAVPRGRCEPSHTPVQGTSATWPVRALSHASPRHGCHVAFTIQLG